MGMYTETRLKTAIHRRLHQFDFFLFSGGDVFSQARRIYKDIIRFKWYVFKHEF